MVAILSILILLIGMSVCFLFLLTNYYQFKTISIYYRFHRSEVQAQLLLSLRVSWAETKMSAGLHFLLEARGWGGWGMGIRFQAHSSCCQHLVPCGCRTEVPLSLLAGAWELFSFSASWGHSHSLAPGLIPWSSKPATVVEPFFLLDSLLCPLLPHLSDILPILRAHVISWAHQDNLRILGSAD